MLDLETMYETFALLANDKLGIELVAAYVFTHERKYEFDFALPCCKLAIEVEGRGHQKDNRYYRDMAKYNLATIYGWHILRFTPKEFCDGSFTDSVAKFLYIHPCTHKFSVELPLFDESTIAQNDL